MNSEGFSLDLQSYSLNQFKEYLLSDKLPLSRRMLRENLEANFSKMESMGVKTVFDLFKMLKSAKSFAAFKARSGFELEYMNCLKREVVNYDSRPVALEKLKPVQSHIIEELKKAGIKNTKELFFEVRVKSDRRRLASRLGIDEKGLLPLLSYADLMRINGVGLKMAKALMESGIEKSEEFCRSSMDGLCEKINKNGKKTAISERELKYSKHFAQLVPSNIEWD